MENKIKEPISAGGVVLNSLGQVLVVGQRGTSWSLPKGRVEEGEDVFTAAKREIYEESGVSDLTLIKEFKSYQRYKISEDGKGEDRSLLKTLQIFLFTTSQMELKPIDPDNPDAVWVEKDKVADLLTHPKDKEFFLKIKNEI